MEIEGTQSLKLKGGMNLSAEGGVNVEIKGALIRTESSGPHTIRGNPVMIN